MLCSVNLSEELPLLEVGLGLLPPGQSMTQLQIVPDLSLLRTFILDCPVETLVAPRAYVLISLIEY